MNSVLSSNRAEFIRRIILAVAEIPDRDSPEGQPEMMLVTGPELTGIITSAFESADEELAIKSATHQILPWHQRIVDGAFRTGDPNEWFVSTGASAALAARDAEIADLRAAVAAVPAVDRNSILEEAAAWHDKTAINTGGSRAAWVHNDSAKNIRALKSATPPATAEQSMPGADCNDGLRKLLSMLDTVSEALHYPACWDTAAYPSLSDALSAVYADFECSECSPVPAPVPASEAARDAALYRQLNTPEIADFLKGVEREALHQRDRWGADHDAGKAAEDWFWLLGYLGGKALHAAKSGNADKALHHTISSAAALLNWHAAILGTHTAMRPGIATPADTQQQEKK